MFISVFMLMFLGGIISFSLNRKHLLLMLMSLEFTVLVMYSFMFYLLMNNLEYFFSVIFLIFSVCEGVLGLGLLVSLIRVYGNDYFKSLSILW